MSGGGLRAGTRRSPGRGTLCSRAADRPRPNRGLKVELDRRSFLGSAAAAVAGVAVVARPASAQGAAAFAHGVASGDPLPDRVVLWTRVTTDRDVPVSWTVARDPALTQVVARGTARAEAARDHTVKVDAGPLEPYTTYWYAFTALGVRSPVGRTRTAPAPGQDVGRLRFAVVTCAKYDNGFFNAYARVAEADVDAVLHCGDYFYEGGPTARRRRAARRCRRPRSARWRSTAAGTRTTRPTPTCSACTPPTRWPRPGTTTSRATTAGSTAPATTTRRPRARGRRARRRRSRPTTSGCRCGCRCRATRRASTAGSATARWSTSCCSTPGWRAAASSSRGWTATRW
jgi:hypothetical protein